MNTFGDNLKNLKIPTEERFELAKKYCIGEIFYKDPMGLSFKYYVFKDGSTLREFCNKG